jgi:hypothetical protein
MNERRCPGQNLQFWKFEDIFSINCPHCKKEIEFWKDEPFRLCPSCQTEVRNPRIDLGCAKWCKYAKECLGELAEETIKITTVCDRVILALKKLFPNNQEKINHARKALEYADKILMAGAGAPLIVKTSALLNEISSAEELEVRKFLSDNNVSDADIDAICGIVQAIREHRQLDSMEFKIVSDAANLVRRHIDSVPPDLDVYLTQKGRELALSDD